MRLYKIKTSLGKLPQGDTVIVVSDHYTTKMILVQDILFAVIMKESY